MEQETKELQTLVQTLTEQNHQYQKDIVSTERDGFSHINFVNKGCVFLNEGYRF